jgi:tetratricopeptide (TPR) repeat protein
VLKEWWDGIVRVDAVSNKGRIVFLCMVMGAATVIAALEALVLQRMAPLGAAFLGWVFVAVYALWQGVALERVGGRIGKILVPSGSSTPSVNQHSNIETLEMRGEYAKAAEAYRAVIASQPQDIVACEKLAQLALREQKDYATAIFAWREAEKRSTEPRRQAGYAILIANAYRDNLKDYGKTIVELRRILARYPTVPHADKLRAEIDELKAMHFEAK